MKFNILSASVILTLSLVISPLTFAHESSCESKEFIEQKGAIGEIFRQVSESEIKTITGEYFQKFCNEGGDHDDVNHKCRAVFQVKQKTTFLDSSNKTELFDIRFSSVQCVNAHAFKSQITAPLRECMVFRKGSLPFPKPFPGGGWDSGSEGKTSRGFCIGNMIVAEEKNDRPNLAPYLGLNLTIKYNKAEGMDCGSVQKLFHKNSCKLIKTSWRNYQGEDQFIIHDEDEKMLVDHSNAPWTTERFWNQNNQWSSDF